MPVKIGIMSFAHMHAYSYATVLKEIPEAQFVGIGDHDLERAGNMAEIFGVPSFATYEELLRQDIDAVIITAENYKHLELTEMAASAGKHVLCEKPIATTVKDAQAMIDICKRHNVKLMTAFPCRYSPSIINAKEAVQSGRIGNVLAIKGTNHGKMPGGWFIDLEKSGGGAVLDHTVHVADIMRWMLRCEPVEVYAEVSNGMHHGEYDDCGVLTMTFENGVFSTLDTSWSRPKSFPVWGDVTMEIVGTRGCIQVDMFSQAISHYSDEHMAVNWINWGDNLDQSMIKDFIAKVADDLPVSISGVDGLKALEVALAAYSSRDLGVPVRLPLVDKLAKCGRYT